jgi:hypothetical protein
MQKIEKCVALFLNNNNLRSEYGYCKTNIGYSLGEGIENAQRVG